MFLLSAYTARSNKYMHHLEIRSCKVGAWWFPRHLESRIGSAEVRHLPSTPCVGSLKVEMGDSWVPAISPDLPEHVVKHRYAPAQTKFSDTWKANP